MTMTRKTITIPNAMDEYVKSQIKAGRYGNDSEFFRDLVRRDQDRRQADQELRQLIKEGLDSGVSENTVADIQDKVEARLKADDKL